MTRLPTTNYSHSIAMMYYQPLIHDEHISRDTLVSRLKIQLQLRLAGVS